MPKKVKVINLWKYWKRKKKRDAQRKPKFETIKKRLQVLLIFKALAYGKN